MKITVVLDGKPLLTDLPKNGVLRGFFLFTSKRLGITAVAVPSF